MAMRPCEKCLDNRWTYELPDKATVRATCQGCGTEVEFLTKRGKRENGLNKWGKPHKLRMAELGDDMPPKNIDIPGDNPNEVPW